MQSLRSLGAGVLARRVIDRLPTRRRTAPSGWRETSARRRNARDLSYASACPSQQSSVQEANIPPICRQVCRAAKRVGEIGFRSTQEFAGGGTEAPGARPARPTTGKPLGYRGTPQRALTMTHYVLQRMRQQHAAPSEAECVVHNRSDAPILR